MNTIHLDAAKDRIPNIPLLINVVARRVRQLNRGQRPLVKPETRQTPNLDIALKEIAEGKLTAEITFKGDTATTTSGNVITL